MYFNYSDLLISCDSLQRTNNRLHSSVIQIRITVHAQEIVE